MDFALILFVLAVVTGAIWALDRWGLAPVRAAAGKRAGGEYTDKEPLIVEYARAFFPVILIVFLLRSFLVEPFRIPSGSMLPSLYIGDFILVNKFAYGVRLPIVNRKILDLGAPKRGDVVVFRFPRDESTNYIKRMVGLPGDRVVYRDKKLYINGVLMEQTDNGSFDLPETGGSSSQAMRRQEKLDQVIHDILVTGRPDHTRPECVVPPEFVALPECVVPPGHYLVMGDNRDHSNDSRYWGYVPERNLVGRAFLIWFSWDLTARDVWFWDRVVFDRIGTMIR